jgi:tRNA(fMet)-specific endonuclease VapC
MYLFDTDVLSDSIKPRPSPGLAARMESLPREIMFTSAITVGEIYYGAYRVPSRTAILKPFEEHIFPNLTILPFDAECARIYGRTKARLEKRGISKGGSDLRIAAIALRHGMTLVTGNLKHFAGIPRLRAENWMADTG